jgi:hypothetical protein
VSLHRPGWPGTHYVAQPGVELSLSLPRAEHVPACLAIKKDLNLSHVPLVLSVKSVPGISSEFLIFLLHWLPFVTCWCRGSLPSEAGELASEAAEW